MPRGRPKSAMSIARLQQLLQQADRQLQSLLKRRKALADELAKVDAQIAVLQGEKAPAAKPKTARRRTRGGQTLPQVVTTVLLKAGKPMRLKDIVTAVLAEGYKSTSKDFYNVVSQTLHTRDDFKNVARGVYGLDAGSSKKKAKRKKGTKKKS